MTRWLTVCKWRLKSKEKKRKQNKRKEKDEGETYPVIRIPIHKHHPPSLPTHQRRHLLKLALLALPLNLERLLSDLILVQPGRVLPPPKQQHRIRLLRLDNLLLDAPVDGRLLGAHEPGAHVDAARAQAHGRGQAETVGEATRGDEGRLEGLSGFAEEDEIRQVALAYMPCTLEAVNAEEVNAKLDGALSVTDSSALVQDSDAGLLQLRDDGTRRVARRLDDTNPLVNDSLRVGAVVGWYDGGQKRDVDGERFRGQCSAAADLVAESGGRREDEAGDDAETACVGDGGGEVCGADVHHSALNDGH